ncbi:MAG TPA: ribulose-phosphate 3-epimerase [Candidatus Bathyarchaeia archaeon]|nr:ribulose-phosphate 3-epimerase [Candidatus Bathyarchaeia archaeon]
MILIEPSILSADLLRLGEQAKEAEDAKANGLQIDVMDGEFAPNITFGPDLVRALRRVVNLKLDAHLMINEPERFLIPFADAGADRIIIHEEACTHFYRVLQSIKSLNIEAGVAINPGTALEAIHEVLDLVDFVQVMTVSPGFSGQHFIASQLDKVKRLRQTLEEHNLQIPIGVDGGIHMETAPLAVAAGATVLVGGSSIFNNTGSVAENIAALRESITKKQG